MKIVWDETKRRTNLATHGLDLADAESFDWDTALVAPDMPAQAAARGFGPSGVSDVTL